MAPLPGEVTLCTLFADVHYYFSHPAVKPPHHRFDKRSYLYLYHDALNRRGRLEVANYAGTPEQDAFMGYLDGSSIEYSYKHPTLFSITADARGNPAIPSYPQQSDLSQWHLPAPDPQNQGKYMYKLHTVDIYLWTAEDASLLIDCFKRVIAGGQLQLINAPSGMLDHRDSISPVVQQLERAAIAAPDAFQPSSNKAPAPQTAAAPTYPTNTVDLQTAPASSPSYGAVPAYNPAAPAAPEPIAHREKTPPPPDADSGTGLAAVERHDTVPQFAGPPQQQSFGPQAGQPSFAGPPSAVRGTSISPGHPQLQGLAASPFESPPPPQQQPPFQATFAPPPTQGATAHLYAQQPHPGLTRPATFGGYPAYTAQQPSFGSQAGTPGVILPPQQPPLAAAQIPAVQPPSYQRQQQYAYGSHDTSNINHSIHQMAYIPEHGKNAGMPARAGPGQQSATGWFENAINKTNKAGDQYAKMGKQVEAQLAKPSKFEKRINKFLKTLDEGV